MKIWCMASLLVLIATAPSAAEMSAEAASETQEISGEDAEVIANLEFLESLEFLEEEIVFSDDYEVLDEWEGNGNEQ